MADGPDMSNRDPNDLNSHVKVMFEDVLGEPEGAHSADCVWGCAYKCFNCSKNCCYLVLTYLCAIPMSLCWGCKFACIAFCHIWKITPCLKVCQMNLGCMQKMYGYIVACMCNPICEAFALCFSKINVSEK